MKGDYDPESNFPCIAVERIVSNRNERRILDYYYTSWEKAKEACEEDAGTALTFSRYIVEKGRQFRSQCVKRPEGNLQYVMRDAD